MFFWLLRILVRRIWFNFIFLHNIELIFFFISIKNYRKHETFCKAFCYHLKKDFLFYNFVSYFYYFLLLFAFFIGFIHWLIQLIDWKISLISLVRLIWKSIKNLNLLIYFFEIDLLLSQHLINTILIRSLSQNNF